MPSLHFDQALPLAGGGSLAAFDLAYESWGTLNAERSNVVLLCHALTVDAHAGDGGWWDAAIGPGRAIDTDRFHVICSNVLGSFGGSTGPASIDPGTGARYAMRLPPIAIADMVDAQARLLSALGIDRLHAVVGGCMGGFQALEWSRRYPARCPRVAALSTTPSVAAYTIALWDVVRRAIRLDTNWREGNYYDGPAPDAGLGLGSLIGLLLWMDFPTMQERFGLARRDESARPGFTPDFEVEHFLERVCGSAAGRMDANALLYLTRAMDYFDLGRGYVSLAEALASTQARFLMVSYLKDWRYPLAEIERLNAALKENGRDVTHVSLDSRLSHGAFQYEIEPLAPYLRNFLEMD